MRAYRLPYDDQGVKLEAYVVYPDNMAELLPTVLVAHDWSGRDDFACEQARELASLGYIGIAIDMYGKGKLPQTQEEKSAYVTPFFNDRDFLLKRIQTAYDCVKQLPDVNSQNIAAIGFCFGGLTVLDLARSGVDIKGVVSFHGALTAPPNMSTTSIQAKILVLHGYRDPLVPLEQVEAFQKEMALAKADWQLHIYGDAMHSFMNPHANDSGFGTVYNRVVSQRAWRLATDFLAEVLKTK